MVIARWMYFLRQHCAQYVTSPSFFQPEGVRASLLGVGLVARDIEQPAQVIVVWRVSIMTDPPISHFQKVFVNKTSVTATTGT